ncbi:MAG TPA: hypothetical protein VKV26_08910 [Dehalococcoidia bacterium]|nr:hypothetical protein [Dehalococcoidia bacterium]
MTTETGRRGIAAVATLRLERDATFRPAGERPASCRAIGTVLDDRQPANKAAQWLELWLYGAAAERLAPRLRIGAVVRAAGRLEHRRGEIGGVDHCAVRIHVAEAAIVTPAPKVGWEGASNGA